MQKSFLILVLFVGVVFAFDSVLAEDVVSLRSRAASAVSGAHGVSSSGVRPSVPQYIPFTNPTGYNPITPYGQHFPTGPSIYNSPIASPFAPPLANNNFVNPIYGGGLNYGGISNPIYGGGLYGGLGGLNYGGLGGGLYGGLGGGLYGGLGGGLYGGLGNPYLGGLYGGIGGGLNYPWLGGPSQLPIYGGLNNYPSILPEPYPYFDPYWNYGGGVNVSAGGPWGGVGVNVGNNNVPFTTGPVYHDQPIHHNNHVPGNTQFDLGYQGPYGGNVGVHHNGNYFDGNGSGSGSGPLGNFDYNYTY